MPALHYLDEQDHCHCGDRACQNCGMGGGVDLYVLARKYVGHLFTCSSNYSFYSVRIDSKLKKLVLSQSNNFKRREAVSIFAIIENNCFLK